MGYIIPVFGMKPSREEIEQHMDHFKAEMLCCTRGPHGQKGTSLNILHKSTDIDGAEDEISRVIRFLNSKEFRVTRKIWPENIMDTDPFVHRHGQKRNRGHHVVGQMGTCRDRARSKMGHATVW